MLTENLKLLSNPLVVFREEFDDWAVLFDPDTGQAFGVNPVGALIWKCLDGGRTLGDILAKVHESCLDVPQDVETHVRQFVQELLDRGLAGTEMGDARREP